MGIAAHALQTRVGLEKTSLQIEHPDSDGRAVEDRAPEPRGFPLRLQATFQRGPAFVELPAQLGYVGALAFQFHFQQIAHALQRHLVAHAGAQFLGPEGLDHIVLHRFAQQLDAQLLVRFGG